MLVQPSEFERSRQLADFVKSVHRELRQCYSREAKLAWENHVSKTNLLSNYAVAMHELATEHWQFSFSEKSSICASRIDCAAKLILSYYRQGISDALSGDQKWLKRKGMGMDLDPSLYSVCTGRLRLLDVGSCYDPFKEYPEFETTALDIAPAAPSVWKADFLALTVSSTANDKLVLQEYSFDVVVFSYFLEYLPSSEMRLSACEKAAAVLKPNGLLIIASPDSKHQGRNSKMIKAWRQALQLLGFWRLQYEKLHHFHCISFRKCPVEELPRSAVLWELSRCRQKVASEIGEDSEHVYGCLVDSSHQRSCCLEDAKDEDSSNLINSSRQHPVRKISREQHAALMYIPQDESHENIHLGF